MVGTALLVGRSRDRFPIVSLDFFINILPAALWPWDRLGVKLKRAPGKFPGVKADGA
jgi:hypothetical protein